MGIVSWFGRHVPAFVVVVAMGALAACGTGGDEASGEGLTVVATTTILGDVVDNVVGDDGDVVVLMELGADPHDFLPSAEQVATLTTADLVVANGLGLEVGLEDVLDAAADDGVRILELGPAVDPLPFGAALAGEPHGSDDDDHGSLDPHIWFDPLRMAVGARLIGDELAALDDSVDWRARADAYAESLAELDREILGTFDAIDVERRKLVTSHEALGYFAARYGFTIIGTIVPGGSTLGDPSSQDLSDLVAAMKEHEVSTIFTDATQSNALAEAVAEELGESGSLVPLYTGSLGEPGSGADTLLGLLRTNAERVAAALGG